MVAYKELNDKIEFFNKFFYVAMITTLIVFFFAVLPLSLVRYYILDMGKDSFYFLARFWFVFLSQNEVR